MRFIASRRRYQLLMSAPKKQKSGLTYLSVAVHIPVGAPITGIVKNGYWYLVVISTCCRTVTKEKRQSAADVFASTSRILPFYVPARLEVHVLHASKAYNVCLVSCMHEFMHPACCTDCTDSTGDSTLVLRFLAFCILRVAMDLMRRQRAPEKHR